MAGSLEPRPTPRGGSAPPQPPLSLAVLDAVPVFRDGIGALIDKTPWLSYAAHAMSQQEAIQLAERLRPDVLLVDSRLDSGAKLVRSLGQAHPALRLVLLVREQDHTAGYLAAALAAGAHGAAPRSAEPHRILEVLRRVRAGRRYLDPSVASLLPRGTRATGDPAAGGAALGDGDGRPNGHPPHARAHPNGAFPGQPPAAARLSQRELQVLRLVAEGLENAAIAKILFVSVETVRTHVKSILRKLSARDRTHAVTLSFRCGLLTLTVDAAPEMAAARASAARPAADGPAPNGSAPNGPAPNGPAPAATDAAGNGTAATGAAGNGAAPRAPHMAD